MLVLSTTLVYFIYSGLISWTFSLCSIYNRFNLSTPAFQRSNDQSTQADYSLSINDSHSQKVQNTSRKSKLSHFKSKYVLTDIRPLMDKFGTAGYSEHHFLNLNLGEEGAWQTAIFTQMTLSGVENGQESGTDIFCITSQ